MANQEFRIYRATPREADDALRFYASGGTGNPPSDTALDEIREAIRKGTWKSDHQILARRGPQLIGSTPFFISPSRTAVIAFPSTAPTETHETAAKLVKAAAHAAAHEGAKLCIALIPHSFPHGGIPFLSSGFRRIAVLANMELHSLPSESPDQNLQWITYDKSTCRRFEDTFAATLQGTLDCPSLPRVQTPSEVLEGHKLAGEFQPDLWLLALEANHEIGCVLFNQLRKPGHFCLIYLGVVPDHRGKRYGEVLMRRAMSEAKKRGATKISLSVDEQNRPALKIYERLGFRRTNRTVLYALSIAAAQ